MTMKNKLITSILPLLLAGFTLSHGQLPTSGLVLHVNGENVTTKASGKVATMTDLSTTGEDLVSFGNGANDGPTLQANSLNGFDTLLIDGSLNGLRIFNANAQHLDSGANGLTLFAVMSAPVDNTASLINYGNRTSSNVVGYSVFTDDNGDGRIHGRAASDNDSRQGTTLTTTESGFFVFGMVIDPTATTDAGSLESFFNGPGTMTSGWVDDGKLDTITPTEDFRIGASTAASGMQLAELAVYDRALSDVELNDVGFTLGTKYNLSTTFVPEPSAAAFMAGLVGLGLVFLRRRS